jgi:Putative zinc-finger
VKDVNRDPDRSLDRLLAETLKARAASAPGDSCLDAETLAEWADDALSARERTAVEAHAADCARCQALLAAMVKTAPASSAAAPSLWRMPALSWLIPAAAVAAALVVWVVVPGRGPAEHDQLASSLKETAAAPASTADAPASREPEAPSLRRDVAPSGAPAAKAQPSAAREAPSDALAKDKESIVLDKATASTNATARSDSAASSVNGPGVTPQTPARVPASPPPSAVLAERNFAAARLGAPETLIVSTNPSSRWRIVPGGNVQRSADGGSTWQLQQTGATVTLAAGASPSPSVCWLVGPDGIVLLSTDDRSWRRIAFPEATPLIAVSATDDRTATVTTLDGRKFSTTDGGVTWEREGAI